jgi:ParB/RepB/Spo0J family partition protein
MPSKSSATTDKPRSLEQMSSGRRGQFLFYREQLSLPEDFNPRKKFKGIRELADSILAGTTDETVGLQNPLHVRKILGTEIIEVTDGERRIRAIDLLISEGHPIGLIPCLPEQRGTTDLQRDLVPLVANSGQDLTLIEKARQYARIRDRHGLSGADIARHCQTTKQAVSNALTILDKASPHLIDLIDSDKIAASTALEIIRQHPGHPDQDTAADNALAAAASTGKSSASPKHLPKKEIKNPKSPIDNDQSPEGEGEVVYQEEEEEEEEDEEQEEETPDSRPPTTDNSPADPGAIQRIQSTPTPTGSGFGGMGGGGTPGEGKGSTDTRMNNIEKCLEKMDEDGWELHPEKKETVELVLNILRGDSTTAALKSFLRL